MTTIDYYNINADRFCKETATVNMSSLYAHFEKLIPAGGHILDCGCGSGRDSQYFMSKGFEVTAMDASLELCKRASELIGKTVECMTFLDIACENVFDGVWACSSLLHETIENLPTVFQRIVKATKVHGVIYASFKYGAYTGVRNGRYFTDLNEKELHELIKDLDVHVMEIWITGDARPGREDEKWINVVMKKCLEAL